MKKANRRTFFKQLGAVGAALLGGRFVKEDPKPFVYGRSYEPPEVDDYKEMMTTGASMAVPISYDRAYQEWKKRQKAID